MSGPGVGFEYPAQEVSWTKRDALLFANSIGATAKELHFLYELDPNFAVFPTYPIILTFKGTTQDVVDFYAAQKAVAIPGVPEFDATRVVDGQRLLQNFKPLPATSAGKRFEIRTKVLGVYDKGRPGTVVDTQTDLVETSGDVVYTRVISSSFYVGQGNWGGPKGPAGTNYPPPKDRQPDAVFEHQTTPETALLYRLNGDYNPLHAHPEPGKKMGFGGVIIHGLYSWNWAAHGLLEHLGGSDPANLKEYQARFASPVRPGDKLVASAWRTGQKQGEWEEVRFEVKIEGGKRRSYDGALCTVRYVGEVAGATGSWLGVEWDDPSRGKHDGQHKGVRYFSCNSKSRTAASFVRPTRAVDAPQTFLSALNLKYASDPGQDKKPRRQVFFSGKLAEEVGFEKIRRQQAQLHELQFVILDDVQVAVASLPDEDSKESIGEVCPKVRELDLSRNLFERFGPVVEICAELKLLRSLKVNGNRFQHVLEDEGLKTAGDVLASVAELALEDTLLEWNEICHIASKFPSLTILHAGSNQLSCLTPIPPAPFTSSLVSLHLEGNDFTSFSDLAPLASIPTLRKLLLKGNRISAIHPPSSPPPVFGPNLYYIDLSYNAVAHWSFIDTLPAAFPGLTSLRFTHNPLYSNPDLDDTTTTTTTPTISTLTTQSQGQGSGGGGSGGGGGVPKTDEAFMLIAARLPRLKVLNFSTVTTADRADAEMFYLSRIARQLAAVPETAEAAVLERHPRWAPLCEAYGEPAVVRRGEVDPNFLEARLVSVEFWLVSEGDGDGDGKGGGEKRVVQVPKSFDIYAVKGVVGKVFGLSPLKVRLVWETGEWDPVGGFDEADGDSEEEEEDLEAEWVRREGTGGLGEEMPGLQTKAGRWVKREVELKDGPRQFGYCVDGLEAKIRVEKR
ncbi:HotDog domain-containing protein [Chaetomidium leptoderma]|uniref:HotDog domain-containing protein n=1 Tax=Chaetomidium leptoderma TaxID=669021 RepID=A0AAN6VSD2_9PEZI|nr:HotDog domain-containing protein [Chaetomidium leptoderma]